MIGVVVMVVKKKQNIMIQIVVEKKHQYQKSNYATYQEDLQEEVQEELLNQNLVTQDGLVQNGTNALMENK